MRNQKLTSNLRTQRTGYQKTQLIPAARVQILTHTLLVLLLLFFAFLNRVRLFLSTKAFLLTGQVLRKQSSGDVSQHGSGVDWKARDITKACQHPKIIQ